MNTWSNSLLARVEERLSAHEYWRRRVDFLFGECKRPNSLHLAVFVEPFLQFVLDGRKTIESRFSIYRRPPFGCVRSGDLVLVKRSGGPVIALAEISQVWYYELDAEGWDFIRTRFASQLCIEGPEFWQRKSSSCFATLMQFERVEELDPLPCSKRDRRGWVVLNRCPEQPELFSNA